MVAVLHQVGGGRVIAIDRAVVLVGRSADCDVVITASQKISRRHCCLVQVDNNYYLRDLGSMNGIWLNGERVNREAKMATGDKVMIGDAEFLFHPNARIEQKNKKATPARPPEPLPTVKPQPQAKEVADELIENIDEFEIVDDIIPLGDDGRPLVETNEVEIIDEPIVDLDVPLIDLDDLDSFSDDIILLDE